MLLTGELCISPLTTFQLFILTPFFQFEQADEATRNRRALEIEKEDTDELQQKYQVGLFDLLSTFKPWWWGWDVMAMLLPSCILDYKVRPHPKWIPFREGCSVL